jgi:hypothetical protein
LHFCAKLVQNETLKQIQKEFIQNIELYLSSLSQGVTHKTLMDIIKNSSENNFDENRFFK